MAAPKGNKYALGITDTGRPPIFDSPEALALAVNQYFQYCIDQEEKATITGLTLFLGFQSRSSLDDYANRSDDFSYIIKRAKLAVEHSYELGGQVIDIFALKNMGWREKSEIDHTTNGEKIGGITVEIIHSNEGANVNSISPSPAEPQTDNGDAGRDEIG